MKNLSEYVRDNSKFLRLESGEVFEGTYVTYKIMGNKFDPEKETVVYKLRYDDGKDAYLQTASVAVAKAISKLKGGERLRIKREGAGTQTKYIISSPDIQISPEELEPDQEVQF